MRSVADAHRMTPMLAGRRLPPPVEAYLADIVRACVPGNLLNSLVLFGSLTSGSWSAAVSDVDLLLVLRDEASADDRRRLYTTMSALELQHGLAKPGYGQQGAWQAFADGITGNGRTFFVCTRSGLLSGDPGKILGISAAQALFVDRILVPGILASAVTVWGEELLTHVRFPPIRRVDVGRAFLLSFNQLLFSALFYPVLAAPTRYAMDALKHSIHSSCFCHLGRTAPLTKEVSFLVQRYGRSATLSELMTLRRSYRPSYGFVLRALPTVALLHFRAARDTRFPLDPTRREGEHIG